MRDLVKFWYTVSVYYQKPQPDLVLKMYAEDCEGFSVEELSVAWKHYKQGDSAQFFPLPPTLKNLARPQPSQDSEAHAVVSAIVGCMKPWQPAEVARERMGELAWSVVKSLGGWSHLGTQPPPDSFALRDMFNQAKSKIERDLQGRGNEVPALIGSRRETNVPAISAASSVVDLVRSISDRKDLT